MKIRNKNLHLEHAPLFLVFNLKHKENIIKKHLKQKSNKKSKIGLQEINHLLNNHPPQSWPLIG